jgi:carbon monoxide dehydrogenase subunit G
MNIVGEHIFSGPREEVYRMLQDPEVLACAFPNTQSLTKIDDTHYESTINIRVGPVSGMFQGKLEVADEAPPEACTLNLEGRAGRALATGTLRLSFVEQAGGLTLLKYAGEAEAGGSLANVGPRMLDRAVRSLAKQVFKSLDETLRVRMAANEEGLVRLAEAGEGNQGTPN